MFLKKICFIFLLLLVSVSVIAQTEEPINTDRPDQSDGTYILKKNKFQLEDGVTVADQTFFNNLMLRYGLTHSTEVRIELDAGKYEGSSGLLPVTISAKQRLIEQKKVIPAITLVGYLTIEKLAGKSFSGNGFPAEVKLAFENEITDQLAIGYNIGASTWFKDMDLTFGISYAPVNRFSFFVEYFSNFQQQFAPEHNVDLGVLFLVNDRFQLDAAAGHSLFDGDRRKYVTAGFSYRFY